MSDNSLRLVVTEERVQDTPLETFYYLGENATPKVLIEYIAFFVADENGEYLEKEEAVKRVLEGRVLSDLEQIANDLREATEAAIVPKA